jgi:hypothetical protein
MRSLRQVLGWSEQTTEPVHDLEPAPHLVWNTLSTLGVGAVADVDANGVVYPRRRPVSVEIWFGTGDRWVRGATDAGVRQMRVAGLPIVETRQRVGEGDVVQTAWADESGDGQGRVVVGLQNGTDVALVVAVVVRPRSLLGAGSISELRVSDTLIVADRRPIVELGRIPGDTAVAVEGQASLHARLVSSNGQLIAEPSIEDADGNASLAAMIPLTPGVSRQIQILDGREQSSVAPSPLDRVVSGWKSHLVDAVEIELPSWPKHVPTSLVSSLLGSVADEQRPLGDRLWKPHDDSLIAVALAQAGLEWAAATLVDRLLVAVGDGRIPRSAWTGPAAACASIVGSEVGDATLRRHGDIAVSVAAELLSTAAPPDLHGVLLDVVAAAHGASAAIDAASIRPKGPTSREVIELARLGVDLPSTYAPAIDRVLQSAARPLGAFDVGLSMVAAAQFGRRFDPIVPVRALAGSTWRWSRDGCGDSAHSRAALLIGLRALCVREPDSTVDLLPGMSKAWLGQNLRVAQLPTRNGRCSFAVRWHGARPALLWEMEPPTDQPLILTCRSLDPTFQTNQPSGEMLLAEPTHLVES